ncbi:protein tipE-like isoform X1 [Daktulosphaira vitifoliae]|uniref:protein tipE-like isoform X1 n=1 Tax=Daktulosphaira vitifoliae TaxID=58002 RepID=UPI0021A9B795|nr:protein tipE-like isoform X1 [Daktulosphaira vitifoliae]
MDDEPVVTDEEKKEAERKKLVALRQKLLFYLTAFFILLAVFSLFTFLFLVPFLIEPAVSTLLMDFDEMPAACVTTNSTMREGASNCSLPSGWASCREGCTKEIYQCAQIFVDYSVRGERAKAMRAKQHRRSIVKYQSIEPEPIIWTYSNARIFPNVKGCGYPPSLNCTEFHDRYFKVGSKYPCYYSREDPSVVITELNLAKSVNQLIYSVVFPIPCFVISVVYVALAYFCLYADQNQNPRPKRRMVRRMVGSSGAAGGSTGDGGTGSASRLKSGSEGTPLTVDNGGEPVTSNRSSSPGSNSYRDDNASIFGDKIRSMMDVDDLSGDCIRPLNLSEHTLRQSDYSNEPSRDWSEDAISMCGSLEQSTAKAPLVNSTGNLIKTMTTSILTPRGPMAEV